MEEENVVKKKKGSFILGVVFSLIGGMIATIPWILVYVYGNMMFSALAIIIAIGAFLGYKISKAEMDKRVPVVIAIVSILCVTLSTLIIIPMLILGQEGYDMTFENLKMLYGFSEFKTAIIQDYVVSFFFTILGMSGIVVNLNKQIKAGVSTDDIKIMADNDENNLVNEETIKKIKETFTKYNAIDKMHTMSKTEVLNEIEDDNKNIMFGYLKNRRIIKKVKGKYYYSEEAEKNPKSIKAQSLKRTIIAIIIVVAIVVAIPLIFNNNSENETKKSETTQTISETNMKVTLPSDLEVLTDEEINTIYQEEGIADFYEFIAMNQDGSKVVYAFVLNEDEFSQKVTPKEYLEMAFEGETGVKMENKTISGYDFMVAEYDYTYQEKNYKEVFIVHEEDNKFICFDTISPIDDTINIENLIQQK